MNTSTLIAPVTRYNLAIAYRSLPVTAGNIPCHLIYFLSPRTVFRLFSMLFVFIACAKIYLVHVFEASVLNRDTYVSH